MWKMTPSTSRWPLCTALTRGFGGAVEVPAVFGDEIGHGKDPDDDLQPAVLDARQRQLRGPGARRRRAGPAMCRFLG